MRFRMMRSAGDSRSGRLPEAPAAVPVARVLREATELLGRAGCDTPRLDAELLLGAALGVERERLILDDASLLDSDALARVQELIARRCRREPVAYILGHKAFRHITLSVDDRVLIPRPETELLVEVGLSLDAGARVVDVGTGSGAVALALKHERADLDVWGTDLNGDALGLARENAARLGLGVRFVQADLLEGIRERFDAVLANLPYVPAGAQLQPEIAQHEPASALFAGPDGLDVIRRVIATAAELPLVALEVGAGQAAEVAAMLRRTGFLFIETVADLAGHERVVVGRR